MQLTIDKWIYGGEGLARATEGETAGKAVFVPFTIPGEVVEAELAEQRPGFARATLEKVITPAPQRQDPPCPYFYKCGGCQYQHAAYKFQVEAKATILRETVQRLARLELPPLQTHSAEPWNYRNRTRLRVRAAPFAIGYNRIASGELLPVEQCPISSPLINRGITAWWEIGRAGLVPAETRETQLFVDASDAAMLVEVFTVAPEAPANRKLADALRERVPQIAGVVFSEPARRARFEDPGPAAELEAPANGKRQVVGAAEIVYSTASDSYRVSAGSFFQTNRFLTAKLVEIVTAGRSGGVALDLYAGTGLFALPLSRGFERVVAAEASPSSYADLRHNAPPHIKAVQATTEAFLARKQRPPDLAVVDPPRAGLGRNAARGLAALRPQRIVYVSCDPATLARDLKVLTEAGYTLERGHLIDLFPQTFHLESVVELAAG